MRRAGAVAALAVLALAGCGSDSSSDGPAKPEPTLGDTAPAAGTPGTRPTEPKQAPAPSASARPPIKQWLIPFGPKRRTETAAYAERHYGTATDRLDPKLIVEHVSVIPTAQGVRDTFASDTPDVELHELPQVCSHFVIDRDGTIYQLVPLSLVCRHTVGLNDDAIGIEHVGKVDADVLGNPAQLRASLRLTTWLRCRYGIGLKNVIGHNESLSSPYHHERVAALRKQTHDDWQPQSMRIYRAKLAKLSVSCGP